MNQIVRSFAAVVDDVKPSERSVVAKIGTRAVDRYKTVIEPRGIDLVAYRTNPVVLFEHGKDPTRGSLPVGRNQWVRIEKDNPERLLAKTIFGKDDFSSQLFDMYCDGTMRGWSVSILPKEAGAPTREEIRLRPELADCELVYRSSELLEYSSTAVPGNPEALSQQELRSIARLVVRGFWSPSDEVKPLVDPIIERMTESGGMADGGAFVADGDVADESDDDEDDKPKKKKRKKKAEARDDDPDDATEMAADEGETRSLDAESEAEVEPVERATPEVEPEPVVEQPDSDAIESVERSTPDPADATPSEVEAETEVVDEPVAEAAPVEPVVERSIPEPEPAPEPVETPEPEVAPVVKRVAPILPPLEGRPFQDISRSAVASIDAWQKATVQRINDLAGWLRGEP